MSDNSRAERLEKLRLWSGCSLFIALPCLIYAGICITSGNTAPGLFALKFAIALVILYPLSVSLYGGNYIEGGVPCGIVSVLAVILIPIFLHAKASAQATGCLSNIRQLAQGTLLYATDYDGVLPNNTATFRTLIFPYVQRSEVFTCPLDPSGTSASLFNGNLVNVATNTVQSPNQTVLIYEGNAQKLNYRHDSRASVVFVDGRCKLITPNQAANLLWTATVPQKR